MVLFSHFLPISTWNQMRIYSLLCNSGSWESEESNDNILIFIPHRKVGQNLKKLEKKVEKSWKKYFGTTSRNSWKDVHMTKYEKISGHNKNLRLKLSAK